MFEVVARRPPLVSSSLRMVLNGTLYFKVWVIMWKDHPPFTMGLTVKLKTCYWWLRSRFGESNIGSLCLSAQQGLYSRGGGPATTANRVVALVLNIVARYIPFVFSFYFRPILYVAQLKLPRQKATKASSHPRSTEGAHQNIHQPISWAYEPAPSLMCV